MDITAFCCYVLFASFLPPTLVLTSTKKIDLFYTLFIPSFRTVIIIALCQPSDRIDLMSAGCKPNTIDVEEGEMPPLSENEPRGQSVSRELTFPVSDNNPYLRDTIPDADLHQPQNENENEVGRVRQIAVPFQKSPEIMKPRGLLNLAGNRIGRQRVRNLVPMLSRKETEEKIEEGTEGTEDDSSSQNSKRRRGGTTLLPDCSMNSRQHSPPSRGLKPSDTSSFLPRPRTKNPEILLSRHYVDRKRSLSPPKNQSIKHVRVNLDDVALATTNKSLPPRSSRGTCARTENERKPSNTVKNSLRQSSNFAEAAAADDERVRFKRSIHIIFDKDVRDETLSAFVSAMRIRANVLYTPSSEFNLDVELDPSNKKKARIDITVRDQTLDNVSDACKTIVNNMSAMNKRDIDFPCIDDIEGGECIGVRLE
jgi:hypothetical protein